MWIKSLFNILIIIILFIISNVGFISLDLTIKEIMTLYSNEEYPATELSFLVNITDYVMLTNNLLFIFCTVIFLFRSQLRHGSHLLFLGVLINLFNNTITFIYILTSSTLFQFVKSHDLIWILALFPVSIIIIYRLAKNSTSK
ncbi:hypothetical protein Xmau_01226 [Xenorhabdus mauleonii]|uniref:Uncharacterized protein n=1 Tax=Xenorhabdus mauleonii TaxID=351675 RepID=A0A1I3KDS6_9GAMM|nr:hypothetical protein Xmau_01226 [Xenorhabdus mauleonii]SFI70681.1 hypothetical protein SAMN05421680_10355 [Xenorhabdus mauleonii]